jgi:hypothetical protein
LIILSLLVVAAVHQVEAVAVDIAHLSVAHLFHSLRQFHTQLQLAQAAQVHLLLKVLTL